MCTRLTQEESIVFLRTEKTPIHDHQPGPVLFSVMKSVLERHYILESNEWLFV